MLKSRMDYIRAMHPQGPEVEKPQRIKNLQSLANLFLKLGVIGFGGPAVHIALMENEVVRKRSWISQQHFLDLVGATNLIPGPNSTELTMHIGNERGGWRGLILAGLCFILPAVFITAFFAWAYRQYGQLPHVQPFLFGIKPAIIAIVAATVIRLSRQALKSVYLGLIGLLAAIAVLAGVNEIVVLFGAGILGIGMYLVRPGNKLLFTTLPFTLLQVNAFAADINTGSIFLIFLKVGAILYGSGYVLFAFLDAELVAKGLLSKKELIDAIAVGQFTPGPVFSSATFIGWQMAGWPGAVAATAGIFLPSFLFVAFLNPIIPRLRQSKVMGAFLDTVNIASMAVILSVLVEMAGETILDWRAICIAVASFLLTFWYKRLNTAWIILGGAVAGYLLTLFL